MTLRIDNPCPVPRGVPVDVQGWLVWRYPGLFWCSVMAWTGGLLYALNLFMRVRMATQITVSWLLICPHDVQARRISLS